jgi:hypothetical protein
MSFFAMSIHASEKLKADMILKRTLAALGHHRTAAQKRVNAQQQTCNEKFR